jgi:hypothetical protein
MELSYEIMRGITVYIGIYHGKIRNAYKTLTGNPERKIPHK